MSSSTMYSPVSGPHAFPRHPQYNSRIGHSASRSTSNVLPKPLPPIPPQAGKAGSLASHSFFKVWWKELSTCFLILGALFAIVGTVLPHDGKPLPDWPYALSINTLVSIYVAILKFAMAFVLAECIGQTKFTWFEHSRPLSDLVPYDDASRGSLWGSLRLLWMLRGRSILASIGAFVTVLAAIIDPFAQQLVSYQTCSLESPSQNASVPVAHIWSNILGALAGPTTQNLGYDMQGAILNGLLSRGIPFDPSFSCATGNCTFDTYYTLGYCSACSDITDEVTADSNGFTATVTEAMAKTISGVTTTVTAIQTLTDDSGSQVSTVSDIETVDQTATTLAGFAVQTEAIQQQRVLRLRSGLTAGGAADSFKIAVNISSTISTSPSQMIPGFDFELLYAGYDYPHNQTKYKNDTQTRWQDRSFGAARCNLQPCVQGYTASVKNGKLNETLIETSYNQSWFYKTQADALEIVRTRCLNDSRQIAALEKQAGVGPGGLPEWYAYNPHVDSTSTKPWNDTNMPLECSFTVDPLSIQSLQRYFQGYFAGGIQADSPGQTRGSNLQQDAFWINGNITFATVNGTMANITRSMSNTMRQSAFMNQTTGRMTNNSTCVHADWRWLSFPAVLTLLTILCFALTGIVTHVTAGDNVRAHDFKTALLPLMFAAARLQQPPHDAQCSGAQSEIEDSVKKRHVRFERTDDGWYFSEAPAATG